MSLGKGQISPGGENIVRCGHLRKSGSLMSGIKHLKKKYFVLRGDIPGQPACLEYYDSKKKFDSKNPPKRSITMRSCYNINRRSDTRHKHVIALYTKDDCFSLILDNEKELDEWLTSMLLLSGDVPDGEEPRPTFEHVWKVVMQKKGLGERQNLVGAYRLCLTDRTLSLIKMGSDDSTDCLQFPLTTIRRCGCMDRIFYMEVGRSAVTGEGDYWMKAEDNNIAHNMHAAIMNAMSSSSNRDKEDILPHPRKRSSSANEASKPISFIPRRTAGQKLHGFSPLGATVRDRCDSLPSRARTTSEGHPTLALLGHPRSAHLAPHPTRPHSMYGRGLSYSPPVSSMPISPASCTCSTDSAGSSLSMDDNPDNMIEETAIARYGHSLTPDEPVILEENMDDYAPWATGNPIQKYSPNFKSHSPSQQSSYVEMHSPSGSSPGRGGAYMPMSPATTAHSHSRASSLVEEMTLPDGYVPMAPVCIDGYVDMNRSTDHNGHFSDDMSQHGSTCSVTSGTPSTDSRLMGYALDKVSSFLPPSDDVRPTRAYSVGSRPDPSNRHRKNRLDIAHQEANRVRAFSVGSRSKRPEISRLINVATSRLPTSVENVNPNKSNSAPLLSSSWGHNSVASDRMEDLMEMDFTRTSVPTTLTSPQSSCSQSQSYSTATDTSSYVDMSPGQPHSSITAPYVDMSGNNKANRNNNNNSTTANHNHNHVHTTTTTTVSSVVHKPVLKTLKPVVESEGSYMQMNNSMDEWSRTEASSKQPPSPMQEDYMDMNGPPGITRTAPVDLPQPRKPPEGYVEMSFKARPSLEQDYINMTMGNNSRTRRKQRPNSRKDKSLRSQPIAIQASFNSVKTPSFLPLNGGSNSASLESTPASTPQAAATPTGSNTTIFPFSLNSPQSPIKQFLIDEKLAPSSSDCSPEISDYAIMTPGNNSCIAVNPVIPLNLGNIRDEMKNERPVSPLKLSMTNSITQQQILTPVQSSCETPLSPLTKKFNELTVSKKKLGRNTMSPITICGNNITKEESISMIKVNNDLRGVKNEKPASPTSRENMKGSLELPQSPVSKKFTELSASKVKLIGSSLNTNPHSANLKISPPKATSPKIPDDMTSPSATPTPTPSPLDSEGYEKLQPGASLLHYASLDLPESSSVPPVSPIPVQDGFRYAEIDFAKLKQN